MYSAVSMTKFIEKLTYSLDISGSNLCVGLDSRYDRLPEIFKSGQTIRNAIFNFNREIIGLTHDLAMGYKMNLAFYAGFGEEGLQGLRDTTKYLSENHPKIPLFADCKRSEMGESVEMIRREIFEDLRFDSVMVTPWFGFDTIRDYLSKPEHGVVVYVHDSNPTAKEFQDLIVIGRENFEGENEKFSQPLSLYEYVAEKIANEWNTNGNVIVEAGLTYPKALRKVRKIVGEDMPILVAGLGAQGGKADDLKGLFGTNGKRLFVNVSRGILFPSAQSVSWQESIRSAALSYHVLTKSN